MRREIGSEFWDVPVSCKKNNLFPDFTNWFLSGRSALQSIISELEGCHSVAIPSWCCDSMIKPFLDAGFSVNFYPVYWSRGLIQEVDYNSDVLFLMDYFGYSSRPPKTEKYQGVIIRDITHSLFSSSFSDAHFYFGSLRKWCGVKTGGFAWAYDGHQLKAGNEVNPEYVSLRSKAMQLKADYINQDLDNKSYLGLFAKAEELLERIGIAPGLERETELARHLDVNEIIYRRRANAKVLQSTLSDWLIFDHERV